MRMMTTAEGSRKIYEGNNGMKGEFHLYLLFKTFIPWKKTCAI